jgi:hypothetical protein
MKIFQLVILAFLHLAAHTLPVKLLEILPHAHVYLIISGKLQTVALNVF